MSDKHYNIIFKGNVLPHIKKEQAIKRLALLLKKEPSQISNLFNGKSHQLSHALTYQAAQSYQRQLADKIGIDVELVEIPTPTHIKSESEEPSESPIEQNDIKETQGDERVEPKTSSRNEVAIIATLAAALFLTGGAALYLYLDKNEQIKELELEREQYLLKAQQQRESTNTYIENPLPKCIIAEENPALPLYQKLVSEALPELIQQNNRDIKSIAYLNSHTQEELLYDPKRNQRLCSLISEYKISDGSSDEGKSHLFKIEYLLHYDDAMELSITTTKHDYLGHRIN